MKDLKKNVHTLSQYSPRKSTSLTGQWVVSAALVFLIVACRLGIDIPNFQPVMAVALFAGFLFATRWVGIATVVIGMILSDLLIGFYQWQIMGVVYLALASPLVVGWWIRRRTGSRAMTGSILVAGSSITFAILFYLSTNLAFWIVTSWYPGNLTGLMSCLAMGLPFFKWTLVSNLFFSGMLFGGYKLVSLATGNRLISSELSVAQ